MIAQGVERSSVRVDSTAERARLERIDRLMKKVYEAKVSTREKPFIHGLYDCYHKQFCRKYDNKFEEDARAEGRLSRINQISVVKNKSQASSNHSQIMEDLYSIEPFLPKYESQLNRISTAQNPRSEVANEMKKKKGVGEIIIAHEEERNDKVNQLEEKRQEVRRVEVGNSNAFELQRKQEERKRERERERERDREREKQRERERLEKQIRKQKEEEQERQRENQKKRKMQMQMQMERKKKQQQYSAKLKAEQQRKQRLRREQIQLAKQKQQELERARQKQLMEQKMKNFAKDEKLKSHSMIVDSKSKPEKNFSPNKNSEDEYQQVEDEDVTFYNVTNANNSRMKQIEDPQVKLVTKSQIKVEQKPQLDKEVANKNSVSHIIQSLKSKPVEEKEKEEPQSMKIQEEAAKQEPFEKILPNFQLSNLSSDKGGQHSPNIKSESNAYQSESRSNSANLQNNSKSNENQAQFSSLSSNFLASALGKEQKSQERSEDAEKLFIIETHEKVLPILDSPKINAAFEAKVQEVLQNNEQSISHPQNQSQEYTKFEYANQDQNQPRQKFSSQLIVQQKVEIVENENANIISNEKSSNILVQQQQEPRSKQQEIIEDYPLVADKQHVQEDIQSRIDSIVNNFLEALQKESSHCEKCQQLQAKNQELHEKIQQLSEQNEQLTKQREENLQKAKKNAISAELIITLEKEVKDLKKKLQNQQFYLVNPVGKAIIRQNSERLVSEQKKQKNRKGSCNSDESSNKSSKSNSKKDDKLEQQIPVEDQSIKNSSDDESQSDEKDEKKKSDEEGEEN